MSIINSARPDYNQNNQHTTIIKAKISSLGKMIQKWEYVEMKKKHIFVKIRQSHAHLQIMMKKNWHGFETVRSKV